DKLEALQIQLELRTVLDSVGLPDYALWAAGGRIVPALTSSTLSLSKPWWASLLYQNSLSYWYPPELAITPEVQPGKCWPMAGNHGSIAVEVTHPLSPSFFSIDHIPKQLTLQYTTAPRSIEIWGIPMDQEQPCSTGNSDCILTQGYNLLSNLDKQYKDLYFLHIANITYDIHTSLTTQTVPASSIIASYNILVKVVLFLIRNNWGSDLYTCIYRIRIHA
ncbi:hypothetical protein L227DRAFT_493826, partial [Lentinus tigrinus ALCF2SS1-6]